MNELLIAWMLISIVQVHGGVGSLYSSEDECKKEHSELLANKDTLYLSDCIKVELKPTKEPIKESKNK